MKSKPIKYFNQITVTEEEFGKLLKSSKRTDKRMVEIRKKLAQVRRIGK